MLTPMTKNYQQRDDARKRIQERYSSEREVEDATRLGYTVPMPAREALIRVMAAAENPGRSYGYGPDEPDREDLLAALALVDEAREQLDNFELRLIRQSRQREISWTDIAVPLGMRTRQSAESRAMRLERAAITADGTRDVAQMRARRAADRDLEQWAVANEERLRAAAEALVDSFEAWTQADIQSRVTLTSAVQLLSANLVAGAGGPALWEELRRAAYHLLPYNRRAPKPKGDKAAAAAAAVHELSELQLLASRAQGTRW